MAVDFSIGNNLYSVQDGFVFYPMANVHQKLNMELFNCLKTGRNIKHSNNEYSINIIKIVLDHAIVLFKRELPSTSIVR